MKYSRIHLIQSAQEEIFLMDECLALHLIKLKTINRSQSVSESSLGLNYFLIFRSW